MSISKPNIINDLMTDRAGRGRSLNKNGKPNKPKFVVAHRQEGKGNPKSWFLSLGLNSPNSADCTIWISYSGEIKRFLYDTDTAWTNGSSKDVNGNISVDLANPEIKAMVNEGVYSGDISLTIEFEGYTREPLTPAQISAGASLLAYWCETHDIPCNRIRFVGHCQLGQHKYCPGDNFPYNEIIGQAVNTLQNSELPTDKTNLTINVKPIKTSIEPKELTFKEVPYKIVLGFKDFYLAFGGYDVGLRLFGLPKEDEHVDPDGISRQKFERYTMRYNPKETNIDWIVSGEHVN